VKTSFTAKEEHVQVPPRAKANGKANGEAQEPKTLGPVIRSSAQFVQDFRPPDYLIVRFMQRRYCYALTAATGAGKTAIALLMAACVALGLPFGGRATKQGRVLILAGENPDDIRARWLGMSVAMSFDVDTIDVHFIPGAFKISALVKRIAEEVAALGGVSLIVVDTSAAYFETEDENSNTQQGDHARRLRSLTELEGRPAILVNCHPVKNANDENLSPRGGGAFVAEIDGNLTACRDDTALTLHWQVKHRGPDFTPMGFVLETNTYDCLRDSDGGLVPTVIARHLTDEAQDAIAASLRTDEDKVMEAMAGGANSLVEIAKALGWYTTNSEPNKTKARRIVNRLKKAKYVTNERGRTALTPKGSKATKRTEKTGAAG
jgi:AAA domain